ncbi:SCO family protein [Nitrospirillum viridazoti]|uniref:Protein SCO1/2 n=2 Tax=Nitrospirillum TaxID=1543705 RepID=A0A560HUA4_9PROT|nr:SCO family protein [Nitrospirillum amazonense]TWB49935.1 protein SCO1/2 [Nitrospirillum amazonense]
MAKKRLIRLLVTLVPALAFAALVAWWLGAPPSSRPASSASSTGAAPASGGGGQIVPGVAVGGPFTLVDQSGKTVTEKSYAGSWRLMFFGYTFCPDICPTELQVMAQAMDQLGVEGDKVQPIFVSVDPGRDTPQQLSDYVAQFHPRLVGLTGTAAQVSAATRAWRVYAAKVAGDDPENYLMDHSTYVYLMDPDNRLVTIFARGTTAEDMVKGIREAMAKGPVGK